MNLIKFIIVIFLAVLLLFMYCSLRLARMADDMYEKDNEKTSK